MNQAGYAVLRAPASGVIAQRLAEAGQVVAAGQTVFVLAEDGEREVAISVPERDARDFSVGRPLAVELWSRPGERFPGALREISPSVPLSAVHEKDGEAAVWVVDPAASQVNLRPVVLGAYGEDRVPVREGLAAGDWVVAAGVHLLLEGQRITPIDDQNRPVDLAPPASAADAR